MGGIVSLAHCEFHFIHFNIAVFKYILLFVRFTAFWSIDFVALTFPLLVDFNLQKSVILFNNVIESVNKFIVIVSFLINLHNLTDNLKRTESNLDYLLRSKGIRQWSINWCTSPMMISKITRYVELQLVVETCRQWTKQSKLNKSPQSCWDNE